MGAFQGCHGRMKAFLALRCLGWVLGAWTGRWVPFRSCTPSMVHHSTRALGQTLRQDESCGRPIPPSSLDCPLGGRDPAHGCMSPDVTPRRIPAPCHVSPGFCHGTARNVGRYVPQPPVAAEGASSQPGLCSWSAGTSQALLFAPGGLIPKESSTACPGAGQCSCPLLVSAVKAQEPLLFTVAGRGCQTQQQRF